MGIITMTTRIIAKVPDRRPSHASKRGGFYGRRQYGFLRLSPSNQIHVDGRILVISIGFGLPSVPSEPW